MGVHCLTTIRIRMLVLALGLICVANALPADMTVQEAHSVDGLIKPELLKPKIYIQPTVRQNNGTMPPPMPSMDRADSTCGCGYSISNPAAGRIVAGSEVSPVHKLPYQVYLQCTVFTAVDLGHPVSRQLLGNITLNKIGRP